jgi:hypothetical protein
MYTKKIITRPISAARRLLRKKYARDRLWNKSIFPEAFPENINHTREHLP